MFFCVLIDVCWKEKYIVVWFICDLIVGIIVGIIVILLVMVLVIGSGVVF